MSSIGGARRIVLSRHKIEWLCFPSYSGWIKVDFTYIMHRHRAKAVWVFKWKLCSPQSPSKCKQNQCVFGIYLALRTNFICEAFPTRNNLYTNSRDLCLPYNTYHLLSTLWKSTYDMKLCAKIFPNFTVFLAESSIFLQLFLRLHG